MRNQSHFTAGAGRFAITDTKCSVPAVTLSSEDNAKLLQQLKSGFKRTINWNKHQSDSKTYAQNQHLNHPVRPSFQGVNRLFVLSIDFLYYLLKMKMLEHHIQNSIFEKLK